MKHSFIIKLVLLLVLLNSTETRHLRRNFEVFGKKITGKAATIFGFGFLLATGNLIFNYLTIRNKRKTSEEAQEFIKNADQQFQDLRANQLMLCSKALNLIEIYSQEIIFVKETLLSFLSKGDKCINPKPEKSEFRAKIKEYEQNLLDRAYSNSFDKQFKSFCQAYHQGISMPITARSIQRCSLMFNTAPLPDNKIPRLSLIRLHSR